MSGIATLIFTQSKNGSTINEDYAQITPGIPAYAVADGVSRPRQGRTSQSPSSKIAAEAFCKQGLHAIEREDSIIMAFRAANKAIEKENQRYNITPETVDYYKTDFLACTAVLATLGGPNPHTLTYGYIGDCGILIYDRGYLPIFLSENPIQPLEKVREGRRFQEEGARDLFWRKVLRNRPGSAFLTYGTLTGEAQAISYVRTGTISLYPGDTVVLFSDGVLPYLFDRNYRETISIASRYKDAGEQKTAINRALVLINKQLKVPDDNKTFIAVSILDG